jgi:glycosyltransferase involved in cell wall biosynthesis
MREGLRISVVIPVHNGLRTLRRTLETVRRQKEPPLEVIVVDDASTEDIKELVREMGAVHHRLPMNVGPAIARTEGARVASGEVILFTDSDVWLPEGLVGGLRKAFAAHECECVQGTFSRQCPHPNFFSQYKNLFNRYVLGLLPDWIGTTYTSVTAVRREFFFKCGGFDENIRTASIEDRTLGENIVQGGGRIYFDRGLEVVHNKHLDLRQFLRSQYRRSRDLAKLMLRQRESGFLGQGQGFGTTSREAMLRLPIAAAIALALILSLWSEWFLLGVAGFFAVFGWLSRGWIGFLVREKGWWFALRGWFVDLVDAFSSGLGVASGLFDYLILKKRY